jgi:hypothetical protein
MTMQASYKQKHSCLSGLMLMWEIKNWIDVAPHGLVPKHACFMHMRL